MRGNYPWWILVRDIGSFWWRLLHVSSEDEIKVAVIAKEFTCRMVEKILKWKNLMKIHFGKPDLWNVSFIFSPTSFLNPSLTTSTTTFSSLQVCGGWPHFPTLLLLRCKSEHRTTHRRHGQRVRTCVCVKCLWIVFLLVWIRKRFVGYSVLRVCTCVRVFVVCVWLLCVGGCCERVSGEVGRITCNEIYLYLCLHVCVSGCDLSLLIGIRIVRNPHGICGSLILSFSQPSRNTTHNITITSLSFITHLPVHLTSPRTGEGITWTR